MELDPTQLTRVTALLVFTVAGIDLGIAFLMRAITATSPDLHD